MVRWFNWIVNIQKMSTTTTNWVLKLFDKVSKPLRGIQQNAEKATKSGNKLGACFKRVSAIDFFAVGEGLNNLNQMLDQAIAPGSRFQSELAEVEAITGVTGEALKDLGERARASALQFGGSAADSLNNYKTLLSRLGPELSKSPELLEKMEHNVRTLSKTMGGDTVAAVDALTTGLLQYGVDLSDPIKASKEMARMMNVMAAGAKKGAAEVPQISAALKVAGVQASQSNVSFEATNAALQALAAGGKEGAQAGTALRNVLGKMAGEDVISKEAVGKLHALGVDMDIVSNTSIPLTARLKELKKAQADATLIAQIFGVENAAAANILLNSIEAQKQLKKEITGTNTASEQAAVIMDTYSEKMSRLSAWFDNIKISLFNATKAALPFLQTSLDIAYAGSQMGTVFSGLGPVWEGLSKKNINLTKGLKKTIKQSILSGVSFKSLGLSSLMASAGTWTLTGSIKALSSAIKSIPVVGWILAIIGALIALFSYLWKNSEKFRGFIYGTWNVIKLIFGKIWGFISPILDWIGEKFVAVFSGIWNTVKSVFSNIWGFVKTSFNFINSLISKALSAVSGVFKSIFGGMYDSVVGVFKKLVEKVKHYIGLITAPIKKVGGFIASLWNRLTGSEVASDISKEFQKGMAQGDAEIVTDQEKKAAQDKKPSILGGMLAGGAVDDYAGFNTKSKTPNQVNTKTSSSGLAINGHTKGNGKTLNMTLNVVNNFAVDAQTNMRQIADEIVGMINDGVRDAATTLG